MSFKEKRGDYIDEAILYTLRQEKKPISTRDIALKNNFSWHTVINHCLRLQMNKKIEGYKISNMNVWMLKGSK